MGITDTIFMGTLPIHPIETLDIILIAENCIFQPLLKLIIKNKTVIPIIAL